MVREADRVPVDSSDEDLRWSAAHSVSGGEDRSVLPSLLRWIDDADGDVRWQVMYGLAFLISDTQDPDDPALVGLRHGLRDSNEGVKAQAEAGLRRIPTIAQ